MEIVLVSAVVVAVAGGVGYFVWKQMRKPKEQPVFYYHCECKRKLRYEARQANHKGICPVCRRQFTFPAVAVAGGKRRS
jgi:hypothetical protein